MKLYFNVEIKGATETAWFTELRLNVRGWMHNEATEPNKFKGEMAQRIADELCNTIRFIKNFDIIPRRSSEGGGNSYKGKTTVTDLIYWVHLYRKNVQINTSLTVNQQFINKCCEHIRRLVNEGRRLDAVELAGNPIGVADCWNDIVPCGGNRGYTADEHAEVLNFCDKIGLDIHHEVMKWYESRPKKPAVREIYESVKAVQQGFEMSKPKEDKDFL
jgi:hypothetical protein